MTYHPLIEDKCQYPYKKERTKLKKVIINFFFKYTHMKMY